MRVLKHFTANNEQLENFPFKRELSMESYLIENEGVLALDHGSFTDVEIIEEELTLKQGRKSQDTDGRIDILVTYNQEYIGIVELKLGQLQQIHLTQLEDYLSAKDQILDDFPQILDNEINKTPKWIGVLVGDSIDPKLASKISDGYMAQNGTVPIAALTINRFKGNRGDIFVTTDTYFKDTTNKQDRSKYSFSGNTYGKGRLVLAVLQHHVESHPDITFSELMRDFPKYCQGPSGVFVTSEEAANIHRTTGRKRHFLKPNELVTISDSTIAISSQWGIGNINNFISRAEELKYKIVST